MKPGDKTPTAKTPVKEEIKEEEIKEEEIVPTAETTVEPELDDINTDKRGDLTQDEINNG